MTPEMPSNLLVVSLGLGTVFIGLICLVLLCTILGILCKGKRQDSVTEAAPVAAPAAVTNAPIANKQEIIAACCAVISEEIGTEASNIKVVSFKRV